MTTEQDVKAIGFELVARYNHDQFNTNRYRKGILKIEFTYEAEELRTVDLMVSEIDNISVNKEQLKTLDQILN